MKTKINSLTAEQQAMMPVWRDKWIEIGLKTGETDWKTFEANIKIAYEKANLPFPNKIIRVESPIVGALAASISDRILNNISFIRFTRITISASFKILCCLHLSKNKEQNSFNSLLLLSLIIFLLQVSVSA